MSDKWTRADLPSPEELRDVVDGDITKREAVAMLYVVSHHLNSHHPPSGCRCDELRSLIEGQKDNVTKAQRERDEATKRADELDKQLAKVENRAVEWSIKARQWQARADEAENRAGKAEKEVGNVREELGRAYDRTDKAYAERHEAWETTAQLRVEVRRLEREVDAARSDQRLAAWDRIADHQFFADCYQADGSLIDAMMEALDRVNDVNPPVTLDAIETALDKCPHSYPFETEGAYLHKGWVVDVMCALLGVDPKPVDPVEAKAKALFVNIVGDDWASITEEHREDYRAAVRDILGDAA